MALFLAWTGDTDSRADLLGHWRLDGDLTDAAHNFDGTLVGSGTPWIAGAIGQAIELRSGTGGYGNYVNTGLSLDAGPKTMVFFAATNNYASQACWAGNEASSTNRFYYGTMNGLPFIGAGSTATTDGAWQNTTPGVFNHYAYVDYGSADRRVVGYQNGVQVAARAYLGSTATDPGKDFEIGRAGGSGSVYANAALDDVAVFNTALAAADIQYIAQHGVDNYVTKQWLDAGWNYGQEVTVSSAVTGTNLTEFPLLVKIADPSNPIFANARSDGHDIAFSDANGNQLAHEIESYNAATGELAAWVKTNVSANHDTRLKMYYGNSGATDQQDAEAVWDGNFKMVQHFDETSGGKHFDSTSNGKDATVTGANMNAPGKISGGDYFDGNGDWVDLPYGAGINPSTSPHTFSMWVKSDAQNDAMVISSGQGTNDRMYVGQLFRDEHDDWEMGIQGSGWGNGTTSVTGEWTYLTLVMDGSTARLYVNGESNYAKSYTSYSFLQDLDIGRHGGASYYFKGWIDEVRISDTARGVDWIRASYLTQLYGSGDQYVTFGPQMALPEPGSFAMLALGAMLLLLRRRR